VEAVERLAAIQEIQALKARYFRCMDTKDWDGFAQVFAPDAEMDMRGEVPPSADDPDAGLTRGNQAIADFVRRNVDPVVTVHHGHMPEIELTSDTTARGIWAMEDHLWWPEGSPIQTMHGYGHYHETYERIADAAGQRQWRIKSLTLTRLRIDVT
jgi:hypothetical protein